MHLTARHGWFIALLALASVAMLWRLDAHPYVNFDESIHGEVSWEMAERGDWVTPSYTNAPYFRKPPLKIWMTSALIALHPSPSCSPSPRGRGEGEEQKNCTWLPWALRLPSALAGIGVVLLTGVWTFAWLQSRWAALLAGMIVATSPAIFAHAFRTGEMDGVLTFFVLLALYAWWRATSHPSPLLRQSFAGQASHSPSRWEREDQKNLPPLHVPVGRGDAGGRGETRMWLLLCGAAIGLAVMTKSAAGLLPIPIIALHWLAHRRTIRIPLRSLLWSWSSFIVIVLPWHLAMTALHGAAFWNEYLGFHILDRVTRELHNAGTGPLWYVGALRRLSGAYFPWIVITFTSVGAVAFARGVWWFVLTRSPLAGPIAWLRRNIPESDAAFRRLEERGRDGTRGLLIAWWLVTFLGFSLAQTKFAWYLLPLLPASAMLVASLVARTVRRFPRTRWIVVALMLVTVASASRQTFMQLTQQHKPSPFRAVAALLRDEQANGLVAYGFAWQDQPAAYFTLRTEVPDVRISDGLDDVQRTREKLDLKERSWLLTRTPTTLPEELRANVGAPLHVGDWSLMERAAP